MPDPLRCTSHRQCSAEIHLQMSAHASCPSAEDVSLIDGQPTSSLLSVHVLRAGSAIWDYVFIVHFRRPPIGLRFSPQKLPSLLSPSFSVGHNTSESCGRIYQSSGSFAQIERGGGGDRSCPCPRSPFPGPGVLLRSWVNRLSYSSQIYRAHRTFSKPAPLCG